ncbi:MAG TPA: STAS domain-containing protein [Kiritimatiellia bacterium]|nr:STAS domain-containing protein [Kiritimatiellia bacterium]HRZ12877.1 STAS domain-containing protein [Kiritimatiellia bacterium]HSA18171.1 STAS domain-containing protein [Kiritimatiellia bacterium]
MPLKTTVEKRRQGGYLVRLQGRLDSETTPGCEKKILPLLEEKVHTVVLEAAGLEYISSAGLRLVLELRKQMAARKGHLALAHLQPAVAQVFEVADILPRTGIFDSVESADMFLDAIQRREQVKSVDETD